MTHPPLQLLTLRLALVAIDRSAARSLLASGREELALVAASVRPRAARPREAVAI